MVPTEPYQCNFTSERGQPLHNSKTTGWSQCLLKNVPYNSMPPFIPFKMQLFAVCSGQPQWFDIPRTLHLFHTAAGGPVV